MLHDIVVGFLSGYVAVYTVKKAVSWVPFIGGSLFFIVVGHQEGYIDRPTFDKISDAINNFSEKIFTVFNANETLLKNATNFINWLGPTTPSFAVGIAVALLTIQ